MNDRELRELTKDIGTADIVDAISKTYPHHAHISGLVSVRF